MPLVKELLFILYLNMTNKPTIDGEVKKDFLDKCTWCGKTYEDHMDKQLPNVTPKVPCLLLKSGFVSQSAKTEEIKPEVTIDRETKDTMVQELREYFADCRFMQVEPKNKVVYKILEDYRQKVIDEVIEEMDNLFGKGDPGKVFTVAVGGDKDISILLRGQEFGMNIERKFWWSRISTLRRKLELQALKLEVVKKHDK